MFGDKKTKPNFQSDFDFSFRSCMSRLPPFSLIKIYNLFDAIIAKKLHEKKSVIVPTHRWWEELYTEMGFFLFQTILTDRYIHRRELRLVSLESSSSVEYEIKNIFRIFLFYGELSRYKFLRKLE